jgi:hypothetical protein
MSLTFTTLLHDAARRRGFVPETLSATDAAAFTAFAADRLREGWTWGVWPTWCPVVRVIASAEWAEDVDYAAGAVVWYSATNTWYVTAAGAPAGTPVSDPVWAVTATPVAGDYETVFTAYLADPRDNPRALRTAFLTVPGGVVFPEVDAGTEVWLHYRRRVPAITSTAWWVGITYSPGAVVWDEASGDCYVALTVSTGAAPATSPAAWSRQGLPQELAEFLKAGVAADSLQSVGQYEQAARSESRAQEALVRAYDKAVGQTRSLRW